MSILARTAATLVMARALAAHPVVQAGLVVAPLLLTPAVRARAKDVALDVAYGAGVAARRLAEQSRRRP